MDKQKIKQPCAFITGVTGQTGSYLAEFLLEKGYKVVGMKRRTSIISTSRIDHIYSNPNFILEYGNMSDASSIYRLLAKYRPDEIYNLAAQSHVKTSFDVSEETLDVVGMGFLRILNAAKEIVPNARIYQASSSEMFGDNPEFPQNENTKLMPASPYACAKVFAHNLARNYRTAYGMHISCGILQNHESERRGETFVTRKITLAAAKIKHGLQEKLELGNLDAKRDWGYAKEYCIAMHTMLQQAEPDDYVIATGESHSVREFAGLVFGYAGLNIADHLVINPRLFRAHEVPALCGDYSKAKEKLEWTPKVKFAELAKIMYDHDFELVKSENKLEKKQ
jgi:GDPmannose 4,6-dehydratase